MAGVTFVERGCFHMWIWISHHIHAQLTCWHLVNPLNLSQVLSTFTHHHNRDFITTPCAISVCAPNPLSIFLHSLPLHNTSKIISIGEENHYTWEAWAWRNGPGTTNVSSLRSSKCTKDGHPTMRCLLIGERWGWGELSLIIQPLFI